MNKTCDTCAYWGKVQAACDTCHASRWEPKNQDDCDFCVWGENEPDDEPCCSCENTNWSKKDELD